MNFFRKQVLLPRKDVVMGQHLTTIRWLGNASCEGSKVEFGVESFISELLWYIIVGTHSHTTVFLMSIKNIMASWYLQIKVSIVI